MFANQTSKCQLLYEDVRLNRFHIKWEVKWKDRRSKNFEERPRITGAAFSRGHCNATPITPISRHYCSRLSCRYWRFNHPFYYFSVGRITHKIVPSRGGSRSLRPGTRADAQMVFSRGTSVWSTQTDRQTHHATCDIGSIRPHVTCARHTMQPKSCPDFLYDQLESLNVG